MERLGKIIIIGDYSAFERVISVFLLISIALCLNAAGRPVTNPDWLTINYCNSTTAYGRVTIDGEDATTDDMVAAFISGECRGFQNVSLCNNQSFVTLVINGEEPELIEFVFFDANQNLICPIAFTTWTIPGGSIGYPPDFLPLGASTSGANQVPCVNLPEVIEINSPVSFTWIFGTDIYDPDDEFLFLELENSDNVEIVMAAPVWELVNYSGITQIFAELSIEGEPAEAGDIVAAFINGECRAVNEVIMWDSTPFVALGVFGTTCEPISFRIHDISAGRTWSSSQQINSQPGGMIGYPDLLGIDGDHMILNSDLTLIINNIPLQDETVSIILADHPPVSQIMVNITLSVNSTNMPPILELPEVYFPEDEEYQIDLMDYTTDPDSDELTFQVFNNSPIIDQLCQDILFLEPPPNWNGNAQMQILVSDGGRLYSLDTLFIDVIPVNDPPQMTLPDELEIQEDESGFLDLSNRLFDIDDDSLYVGFNEPDHLNILSASPQWEPVVYNNWSFAYLVVTSNGENLPDSTLIAAFSGPECRGMALTSLYQNTCYAIFPIFCQQQVQIKFKAYNPETNLVYFHTQTVSVTPNSNLGFPPDYFQIDLNLTELSRAFQIIPDPDWNGSEIIEITAMDPEQSNSVTQISVNVLSIPDAPRLDLPESINFTAGLDDWLDLSGFFYDPDGDEVILEIVEPDGLNLILENSILQISPAPAQTATYAPQFRAQDETGLETTALANIEILAAGEIQSELSAGWNWISLALGSNHYQPDNLLSSICNSVDYLKSQTGFLYYYQSFGWGGSLLEMSPLSLYKTRLNEPDTLLVSGWELNPELTPFQIHPGFNWISYIPDQPMPINEALAPLNGNASYIKYVNGFALYYPGYGWIGSLQELRPYCGYVLFANNSQTFYYPQPERSGIQNICQVENRNELINPQDYKFTASLTAVIPDYIPHRKDRLIARSNDEIAGFASITSNSVFDLRSEFGEFYYFIYLYTNYENPSELHLQLEKGDTGDVIDFFNTYSWSPDSRIGDLEIPEILLMNNGDESDKTEDNLYKITLFPNPFNRDAGRNQLQIRLPDRGADQIIKAGLYNLKGQKIEEMDIIFDNENWIVLSKNNWDYPNGIYLFNLITETCNYHTKLLILK